MVWAFSRGVTGGETGILQRVMMGLEVVRKQSMMMSRVTTGLSWVKSSYVYILYEVVEESVDCHRFHFKRRVLKRREPHEIWSFK